jgi:hypothetical protein
MASITSAQQQVHNLLKRSCNIDPATNMQICYHLPVPAIIGIVFGVAFLLITGCFIAFLCYKCVRHKKRLERMGEEVGGGQGTVAYNGAKRGERENWMRNAY